MKPEDAADHFGANAANFFELKRQRELVQAPLVSLVFGNEDDIRLAKIEYARQEVLPEIAAALLTGGDVAGLAANVGLLGNLTPETLTVIDRASSELVRPVAQRDYFDPEAWTDHLTRAIEVGVQEVAEYGPYSWFRPDIVEARLLELRLTLANEE